MCSVDDDNTYLLANKADLQIQRNCMKCGQPAVVIIRINDAFCRACFLLYCTHKFRSAFGKSRLIRDQERVLLAFSAGPSSAAMVHLIQEGLSKRARKKLRFLPTLVFIDEGTVVGCEETDRLETRQQVTALMTVTGLTNYVYRLEAIFYETGVVQPRPVASSDPPSGVAPQNDAAADDVRTTARDSEGGDGAHVAGCAALVATLGSLQTLTEREEMVRLLRQRLLVLIARQLGVTKVIVGDTASRLSVRMLSALSQGRGAQLPLEMGFADTRHSDIVFVRPLREFTAKEIAVYNHLNDVQHVFIPVLGTKAASHASIDRLAEEFVSGLQSRFPTTVNTICRTGEKLDAGTSSLSAGERCCMCQAPLDTEVGDASALTSTQYSVSLCQPVDARLSTEPASVPCVGCQGDGQSCVKSADRVQRLSRDDFDKVLCYGCRLLTNHMSDLTTLPNVIQEEAVISLQRRRMKESIQDFLLDDSETTAR